MSEKRDTFMGRLSRFDPALLPIIIAALVLIGSVVWLLFRPSPQESAAAPLQTVPLGSVSYSSLGTTPDGCQVWMVTVPTIGRYVVLGKCH